MEAVERFVAGEALEGFELTALVCTAVATLVGLIASWLAGWAWAAALAASWVVLPMEAAAISLCVAWAY